MNDQPPIEDEAAITAAEERALTTFETLRATLDQARAMGLDVAEDEAALSRSIAALHTRREERRRGTREARGPVLVATPGGVIGTPDGLADLADKARAFSASAHADATRHAYKMDYAAFTAWCDARGLLSLPADPRTVGLYLADHAHSVKPATLDRRLAAISKAHKAAGHHLDTSHPAIRDVRRGIRRTRGVAQRRVDPITVPVLRRLLATCGDRLLDHRDRALLLVGHLSALRRSELVALDVDDVAVLPEGLRITIRRSKADQEGEGQVVAVGRTNSATCPVAALTAWVSAAGITTGPVFRGVDRHGHLGTRLTGHGVAKILKRRAALAGLDPERISGHSLRAGLATSAAAAGVEERLIMKVTRHASVEMVRRYVRDGELFRHNLASDLGL